MFEDDRYVWPVYAVNLRARIRCPVYLLVIAPDEAVARWAAKIIELGGDSRFVPWVLGSSGVPEITGKDQAMEDPELAVLSAMAHGKDKNAAKAVRIAMLARMAAAGLDADRSMLYCDLILHSLPEAALRALKAMDLENYEFQSDFARKYYGRGIARGKVEGRAEGRTEGRTEGRIEIVLKMLASRYGALSRAIEAHVHSIDSAELGEVAERLLTAETVEEALGMVEA